MNWQILRSLILISCIFLLNGNMILQPAVRMYKNFSNLDYFYFELLQELIFSKKIICNL
jgi:hypothetical protein